MMASQYKPGEPYLSVDAFLFDVDQLVYVIPWKRAVHKAFFLSWHLRLAFSWIVKKRLIVRAIKKSKEEIEHDNKKPTS
jgi:hypothetical protein